MKILWCWRCKMDVPMLDEDEFERINRVGGNGGDCPGRRLQEYVHITGFPETNPIALEHHRVSLYGPPCHTCGKPLRTPQARLCGACMAPVV